MTFCYYIFINYFILFFILFYFIIFIIIIIIIIIIIFFFKKKHTLGRIFYYGIPGIPGIPVDYEKAFHYFLKAANQLPKSPLVLSELSEEQKKYYSAVSQSAGFIGYMYWRGEGVEQNMKKAREWLEKGYRHVSFFKIRSLMIIIAILK